MVMIICHKCGKRMRTKKKKQLPDFHLIGKRPTCPECYKKYKEKNNG